MQICGSTSSRERKNDRLSFRLSIRFVHTSLFIILSSLVFLSAKVVVGGMCDRSVRDLFARDELKVEYRTGGIPRLDHARSGSCHPPSTISKNIQSVDSSLHSTSVHESVSRSSSNPLPPPPQAAGTREFPRKRRQRSRRADKSRTKLKFLRHPSIPEREDVVPPASSLVSARGGRHPECCRLLDWQSPIRCDGR